MPEPHLRTTKFCAKTVRRLEGFAKGSKGETVLLWRSSLRSKIGALKPGEMRKTWEWSPVGKAAMPDPISGNANQADSMRCRRRVYLKFRNAPAPWMAF